MLAGGGVMEKEAREGDEAWERLSASKNQLKDHTMPTQVQRHF